MDHVQVRTIHALSRHRVHNLLILLFNSPPFRPFAQLQPLMVKLTLLMNQSLPKFRALFALRSTPDFWTALDPVQQRIVDLTLQDMHLAGVKLAPESPEKARFNAIRGKLSKLGMRFGNNVLDATSRFGEVVRDRAELVGCSKELLTVLAANARKRGITNEADAEKGPWCITLDGPTYTAFMMGCENRSLREKVSMGIFKSLKRNLTHAFSVNVCGYIFMYTPIYNQ